MMRVLQELGGVIAFKALASAILLPLPVNDAAHLPASPAFPAQALIHIAGLPGEIVPVVSLAEVFCR